MFEKIEASPASSHCKIVEKQRQRVFPARANTPTNRRNTIWKRFLVFPTGDSSPTGRLLADDELELRDEIDDEPRR